MILVLITVVYSFLILAFCFGFSRVKTTTNKHLEQTIGFSVIIPFRNEVLRIKPLLESLKKLDYNNTLFEVIFVDDESTDESVTIINEVLKNSTIDYKIIDNNRFSKSPKKDAISTAIKQAKNDWLITTDADCQLNSKWLQSYNEHIQNTQKQLIAGPVKYKIENSFISKFEVLDYLSVQGITIGAFGLQKPFICNGANLCYHRSLFEKVHGFESNQHLASGDDVFMLESALQLGKDKVSYIKNKEAIVSTLGEASEAKIIQQRVRWASKTNATKSVFSKMTAFIAILMNVGLLVSLMFIPLKIVGFSFLIKLLIDFCLIALSTRFFDQKNVLKHYFWSAFLYPFFTLFIVIFSLKNSYQWKGRRFSK